MYGLALTIEAGALKLRAPGLLQEQSGTLISGNNYRPHMMVKHSHVDMKQVTKALFI